MTNEVHYGTGEFAGKKWDGHGWVTLTAQERATAPTRTRSATTISKPRPSASLLGIGMILSVIGAVIFQMGQTAAVEATQRRALLDSLAQISGDTAPASASTGDGLLVVGGLIALVGVVLLMTGVARLAVAVDWLVRTKHAEIQYDLTEPTGLPVTSTFTKAPEGASSDTLSQALELLDDVDQQNIHDSRG